MIAADERAFFDRCLELADRAGRLTAPNPRVGAVVVRDGEIVGEGWHRRAGEAHAEAVALDAAGEAARGATLFCSLEPCAHHGRTPPCTDRIIAAGVRRVVCGLVDPDPRVRGAGLEALAAAGIEVDLVEGDDAQRAERVIEDYLVHRREGRAFAVLKVAATLDGRIADRERRSRWITGAAARAHGRRLRERYGAIVVGTGTVLADDPLLLPPSGAGEPGSPFLRCVLDAALRTPSTARLLAEKVAGSPVIVFTAPGADVQRRRLLERAGAEIVSLGPPGGPIPPADVLRELGRRGVLGAIVEGGGRTHGRFVAAGAFDKILWYAHPSILGDPEAVASVRIGRVPLERATRLTIAGLERLEDDLLLTLYPA
ncbi:MAG: bifunctional diaminohydroxyphosphoribosylaminopyrimidine deaminase/5-amino-6-(5-phosphoribosylamino)uracil reductase RibD [Acidobacteria bacterium]|nr:MAG: bifunctional diaminohydroxyphosphoribosylaminopyrimidine deaminase/5-amino-6-(5-phosphoribosylamino)uracil reductase RibD [Acidobacteriota bacterium]